MAQSLSLVIPDNVINLPLGENDSVYRMVWNPKCDTLAIGTDWGKVYVWESLTNTTKYIHNTFGDFINVMCWNPNGTLFAIEVSHGKVFVWDSRSNTIECVLDCTGEQIVDIRMSWNAEGRLLALTSTQLSEPKVHVWDSEKTLSKTMKTDLTCNVFCVQWNKSGTLFLTIGEKECIIWNPVKEEPEFKFGKYSMRNWHSMKVAWQSDDTFAFAGDNSSIAMFKVGNTGAIGMLNGHTGAINQIKWDTHGELLASCAADKTVKVWSSRSKMCLPRWNNNCHIDDISNIRWLYNTRCGTQTLASFSSCEVKIWATTGLCLIRYLLEPRLLSYVSPSGSLFISAKRDNICKTN